MTSPTRFVPAAKLAWLSRPQMIEVDRVMVDELGIGLIQMMENAGRHLATLVRDRFLAIDGDGQRVVVLAGTGSREDRNRKSR